MTTLERIGLEAAGAIALILAAALWWHLHNLTEQKLGAADCIQGTTVAKSTAVDHNIIEAQAQAADLAQKVTHYETQLAVLSADNAGLVQRVHDAEIRHGAVLRPGAAAGEDLCPIELSNRQGSTRAADERGLAIEHAQVKLLDDCDANYERAETAIAAYNDMRQRIIDLNVRAAK